MALNRAGTDAWCIARARLDDAPHAVEILREVSAWLVELGRPLWDPDSFALEAFARAAAAGELVMGYEGGDAVACMLLQRSDPLFWPNDAPGEALYVHKVAVARRAAGRRWSERLVRWAALEARNAGAQLLRLDTAWRPELLSLYEGYGFTLVDPEPRAFGDTFAVRLEAPLTRLIASPND